MKVNRHLQNIEEILSLPRASSFWASLRNGILRYGNDSTLLGNYLDDNLTFDIGNNLVLLNLDIRGSLRYFTSYGQTKSFDSALPGVWTKKKVQQASNISYKLTIGKITYDFAKLEGEFETSLMDGVIPVTELFLDNRLIIKVVGFAPISADGKTRVRAGIYGIFLKNISRETINGWIYPPRLKIANGAKLKPKTEYRLEPGGSYWLPVVVTQDTASSKELEAKNSLEWLSETLEYFQRLTGKLKMPNDTFMAEFLTRCIHQCFNATAMTATGEIAGEHGWGSFPAKEETWTKDFHYTMMPLVMLDEELAKRGILWFLKWSVRSPGKFPGGVRHSLCNSLAPVAMCGLYYSCIADHEFFLSNATLKKQCQFLLDEALKTAGKNTPLLHSLYISDGPAVGDSHTGSNIFAWYCLVSFARIMEEVFGESGTKYRKAAEEIQKELARRNVINGPFGHQYVEGINLDGSLPLFQPIINGVHGLQPLPLVGHDGEESDTTLASFYEFTTYDDPLLHNHKRAALTEHNVYYSRELDGILWEDGSCYGPTFPGYISGLAAARDAESMRANINRIRELTDLDGSIWWWPYYDKHGFRIKNQPTRGLGKSGWASGVFTCLFISQFLGLKYDAPTRTLTFRPFSPYSNFSWEEFRIGKGEFSARYSNSPDHIQLEIENRNPHTVNVEFQAIIPYDKTVESIEINKKIIRDTPREGLFFDRKVIIVSRNIEPGNIASMVVKLR